ncbi:hypothetical protein SUGI_0968470 [Cryptomeria japonica]|nr:hypothetical protein SUGI_0968470 [Cryptomeria japonica]
MIDNCNCSEIELISKSSKSQGKDATKISHTNLIGIRFWKHSFSLPCSFYFCLPCFSLFLMSWQKGQNLITRRESFFISMKSGSLSPGFLNNLSLRYE